MPNVTVIPSGRSFVAEGNDTLLEAALRSGLALDYGCSNGNCGMCKARLVQGDVERIRHQDFALPEAEVSAGAILLCAHAARSDLSIETHEACGTCDIPRQSVDAKLKKIDPFGGRVAVLHVQTPRTRRLRFLAGQNATLCWPDGPGLELPIASCPCDDRNLQFHLLTDIDDPFTKFALDSARPGAPLTVRGPAGTFVLNDAPGRSLVFLAWDIGFASVKSLIEHALSIEQAPHIDLCWFASQQDGHYMHNLVRSWEDAFDTFHYHPVAFNDDPALGTPNAARLRPSLVADIPWSNSDVYAAGPDSFIQYAHALATDQGVASDGWFTATGN